MVQRKLDELGRLVIPEEITAALNITAKTLLDIRLEDNKIIIEKAGESCALCGDTENVIEGFRVCRACAQRIADVSKLI